jgi:trehalose 6-phosphate phosphatase
MRPAPSLDWCLFLDVDGTLIELSDTPSGVVVDDALKTLVNGACDRLGGAVALVSGRNIDSIDRLFAPLKLPAAGLHGVERRTAAGDVRGANFIDADLGGARSSLSAFAEAHPGTFLEDKGRALAMHFRLAPESEASARQAVAAAARTLGAAYHVQEGKMVFEIKPCAFNKGTAVDEFMQEPPFRGRTPVFVGDDLTDQSGFRVVEARGGISIAVGHRIRGQWRFDNPAAVRRWLATIAALHAPRL